MIRKPPVSEPEHESLAKRVQFFRTSRTRLRYAILATATTGQRESRDRDCRVWIVSRAGAQSSFSGSRPVEVKLPEAKRLGISTQCQKIIGRACGRRRRPIWITISVSE